MPVSSSIIAARTASSGSPRGEVVQLGLARAARHAVDQAAADDERALEHGGVRAADAHALRPGGDLLGVEVAQQPDEAQPPARRLAPRGRCARAQLVGAAHQLARVRVDAQAPVDGRRHAELLDAAQGEVDLLLVEQADELVAQPRRREVADEVHGAAGARQVERVLVHAQTVAALVADGAQDARGVLDEAQVVQHDDAPRVQVLAAAEVVEEVAEGLGLERHRHGVDGEVAAREVAADAGVLDLGQRARVLVGLGARGGHVDAQPRPAGVARRRPRPCRTSRAAARGP